eukprot:scaffold19712_cov75-Phaeocystis_antarctica.AAC.1
MSIVTTGVGARTPSSAPPTPTSLAQSASRTARGGPSTTCSRVRARAAARALPSTMAAACGFERLFKRLVLS